MKIFQLIEEGYEEIEISELVTLYKLLDTENILFIIDDDNSKVWVWVGKTTSTKNKFISAQLAIEIRDKHGLTYNIITVDEDSEPEEFMDIISLEEDLVV
ncbi:MAG: hypothetical protein ACFFAS_14065 [Promethearchaeota archaeon]